MGGSQRYTDLLKWSFLPEYTVGFSALFDSSPHADTKIDKIKTGRGSILRRSHQRFSYEDLLDGTDTPQLFPDFVAVYERAASDVISWHLGGAGLGKFTVSDLMLEKT